MRVMELSEGNWGVVEGDWKVVDGAMVHDDFNVLDEGYDNKAEAQAVALFLQARSLGLKTVMLYAAIHAQVLGIDVDQ